MEKNEMATIGGRISPTITKVERYGWTVKDAPGELKSLNKNLLKVDPTYQRHVLVTKVTKITAEWSWVACGAILVGERDGEFWVIDGQHRVLAALRRADIINLPCIVFQTSSIKEEACGFLSSNTNRKPISATDRFRANIAAENEIATFVGKLFSELGITPSLHAGQRQIKCLGWAMRRAGENREAFRTVVTTGARLCGESAIGLVEILLDGLYYLHVHGLNLDDERFRARLYRVGAKRLLDGARRAATYHVKGGAKVWAEGILIEVNRSLRHKFFLPENDKDYGE